MPKFLYQIKYFNCIVCCNDGGEWSFKKYRRIKNSQRHIEQFLLFAKNKFPAAQYVNFYNKQTKHFIERIYLNNHDLQIISTGIPQFKNKPPILHPCNNGCNDAN